MALLLNHRFKAILLINYFVVGFCDQDYSSISWNFSKWWDERAENTQLYSEPVVFDMPAKPLQQYGDFDKFNNVQYKPYCPPDGVVVTSSVLEVQDPFIPSTSIDIINNTIKQYFSSSRHWSDDKAYMRDLREALKEKFLSFGLKTAFHVFKTEYNNNKMVN